MALQTDWPVLIRLLTREFCTDGRNHACFGDKRYRALRVDAELKIDFQ
jgi:hypothetical protein